MVKHTLINLFKKTFFLYFCSSMKTGKLHYKLLSLTKVTVFVLK